MSKFKAGDLVRNTPQFMRSIGMFTGPVNGIVVGFSALGDQYPEVVWSDDDRAAPKPVHENNLELDKKGMRESTPDFRKSIVRELLRAQRKKNPKFPNIRGPLRIEKRSDGLWVVGQGIASPVESRREAKQLIQRLRRRKNPPDATVIYFDDQSEMAEALHVMDQALRPSRMERPTVFHVDWDGSAIVLEGAPDELGVSKAISALELAELHFDVEASPIAANPKGGTPGKAAGYALLGLWAGGILGFGLAALVGGLAGVAAGGGPGAMIGATLAGGLGSYAGGIIGAHKGAKEGAPLGLEREAAQAAAIGAAIPFVNWFLPPVLAYVATEK